MSTLSNGHVVYILSVVNIRNVTQREDAHFER